jgi:hypothetical protein
MLPTVLVEARQAYTEFKQQLADFVRPYNNAAKNPPGVDEMRPHELNAENPASEELNVTSAQFSNSDVEVDYPKLGSSAMQTMEFVLDGEYDMHRQSLEEPRLLSLVEPISQEISDSQTSPNAHSKEDHLQGSIIVREDAQVAQYVNKDNSLENLEPRRGPIEKALLSMQPWMTSFSSPSYLSTPLENWWKRSRRRAVAKDHTRIEWKCVS